MKINLNAYMPAKAISKEQIQNNAVKQDKNLDMLQSQSGMIQNDGQAHEMNDLNELVNIALALGMDPTQENLDFIDRLGFEVGYNIQKLITILGNDLKKLSYSDLASIGILPDKIPDYLQQYNINKIDNILNFLQKLFNVIDEQSYKKLDQSFKTIINDIVKGLKMQLDSSFPYIFIPIVLSWKDSLYLGDIYIKKDKGHNKNNPDRISISFSLETNNLGRIEVNLQSIEKNITVKFWSNRETMGLLKQNELKLIETLSKYHIHITSITFEELRDRACLIDLVKKHGRAYKGIDITV